MTVTHELRHLAMHEPEPCSSQVLGVRIHAVSWDGALDMISCWASARESRYVCTCNVHSVVTAAKDDAFARVVAEADLATPDGAPIAWMLRRLGQAGQQRINGPDLMARYLMKAAESGESIFLFGGTPTTLDRLKPALERRFPGLRVAGVCSPPFRVLTPDEDSAIVDEINRSGASTVWVALGCPKQEAWMEAHRGRVNAVMIGVGAAFDFFAGTVTRAPAWMQRRGLEWLFRLVSEPSRLWRRYLVTNSLFIVGAARQLARRGRTHQ
jgi:N-acetylglucosaminyldiphosphoundecaprenol N-acetyl-beta-D-mannosaminyltransferase